MIDEICNYISKSMINTELLTEKRTVEENIETLVEKNKIKPEYECDDFTMSEYIKLKIEVKNSSNKKKQSNNKKHAK